MKETALLILIAVTFTACKKENDNNNNNNRKSGVVIKGKISASGKSGNSLADARRVLVFDGMNNMGLNMSFTDIVDGAFTDTLRIGSITALVFLDANNKYIGTFCNRGLNILPLCLLSNGDSTIIDLSTLTLVGTNVIPSHDPFGKEIIITDAELNSLKVLSKFFESLAKNIDADNDGILDVLSDKQIYIKSQFIILGGKFGLNDKDPVISDTATSSIQYNTYLNGGLGFACPASASLSGPEGNPYPAIYTGHLQSLDNMGHGFGTGFGIGNQPGIENQSFKAGIYTLTLDGKPFTLSFSNIDAKFNLVFAAPRLITDSTGKLVSISLSYLHSDYIAVDPENILTDLMIQLNDTVSTRIFDTPWLKSKHSTHVGNDVVGLYTYTLPSPIDISALGFIDIVYNDLLSNLYFIQWRK